MNYQTTHSRQSSVDSSQIVVPTRIEAEQRTEAQNAQRKLRELQERNIVLGKMLDNALRSLRAIKSTSLNGSGETEESLNICLARIQFVSVYLSDSDIPIPKEEAQDMLQLQSETPRPDEEQSAETVPEEPKTEPQVDEKPGEKLQDAAVLATSGGQRGRETQKPLQRPSLMDASFSFMLGENRHRSSFVSSVADLPEERRNSQTIDRPKKTASERPEGKAAETKDDGFTLTRIQGGGG